LKINRLFIVGMLLTLIGILIYKSGFLDQLVTFILWPLLSGSSKGKTILLFVIMGSMLILNSIITYHKIASKITFLDKWNANKYLKFTLILILSTYIISILIEVWLRLKFGVSIFTIFVAEDHTASTTSIMHTHVFKSILGYLPLGETSSSNINTAYSLLKYVYPYALIGFITISLAYITGLLSLDSRRDFHKIILVFALSLSIIAMMDGGIFSQPAIIGIFGLLVIYFLKKPFSPRNLIKPTLIILLIILIGFTLEIAGTNQDHHKLTVINQTGNVNMNGYHVSSIEKINNQTVYIIKPTTGDKQTLENLSNTFKDKSNGYFMTWNLFTYI